MAKTAKRTKVKANKTPKRQRKPATKCPVPMTAKPAAPLPKTLIIEPEATASDARGEIFTLVRHPIEVVQVITSKAGTYRASHLHMHGWHFCHLLSGEIHYYERPMGSSEAPTLTVIKPGQTFFTGPETEHTMFFPVDSAFLNMANSERTKSDYEADLVRLPTHLDAPHLHPQATA